MEIVQLFAEKGYECKNLTWDPNAGRGVFQVGDYGLLKWPRGWTISKGYKNLGTFNLSSAEIVDKIIDELR